MTRFTRRHVLGCTVGAVGLLAGCSESESSSGFTETGVEDQQLVVEFEESLEAETISVVNPAGESFAETDVAAGVFRVTFDISMPYTPGEYRIVAADGDGTVAETTQAIRPDLEIVEVGVGANRLEEMPEDLHFPERQVVLDVENSGPGPGGVSKLGFEGFPTNSPERDGSRIFDEKDGIGEADVALIPPKQSKYIYSTTLPFAELGTECVAGTTESEATIDVTPIISDDSLEKEVLIEYSSDDSGEGCQAEIKEVSDA